MDGMEHTIFACHVVRFGRHGPEWGTSQNIFAVIRSNQIYEIGVTIGKLLHLDVRRALRQVFTEIIRQCGAVEFFAGPDRGGVGFMRHERQCDL